MKNEHEIITNIVPVLLVKRDICWVCGEFVPIVAMDNTVENSWICDDCLDDAIIVDVNCQFHLE